GELLGRRDAEHPARRDGARRRPADADLDAQEPGVAERRHERLHAAVAPGAAPAPDTDTAGLEVDVVVHGDHARRIDAVEARRASPTSARCASRSTATSQRAARRSTTRKPTLWRVAR